MSLYDDLNKLLVIAIYGRTGSGKTSLAYAVLQKLKNDGKKVFFLNHPRPELLESWGFENLSSIEMLEDAMDCVVYIDEPQLILPIYSNKANRIIGQVCSLARQLNITLIMSTSDTRVFNKSNEAYFDAWIVKDLDYDMVKQGSKIKQILRKNALFDPSGLRLKVNEFLFDSRSFPQHSGKHMFEMPTAFTEEHSKPFRRVKNVLKMVLEDRAETTKPESSETLNVRSPEHTEVDVVHQTKSGMTSGMTSGMKDETPNEFFQEKKPPKKLNSISDFE